MKFVYNKLNRKEKREKLEIVSDDYAHQPRAQQNTASILNELAGNVS
jgi:hypothetical protein